MDAYQKALLDGRQAAWAAKVTAIPAHPLSITVLDRKVMKPYSFPN